MNSYKILVVDDEQSIRDFISTGLTRQGFFVDTVIDGKSALKKLEQEVFDIILCDLNMSVISLSVSTVYEIPKNKGKISGFTLTKGIIWISIEETDRIYSYNIHRMKKTL